MTLDAESCYRALRTHDARFDGRFFVGASTTGIYCRPVCPARTPRRENCSFYSSAAAAEAAGLRPCLRCRPELAPGFAAVDAARRLAYAVALWLEEGDSGSLETLARRLGVTGRHLRRAFREELGVSPIEYAQTQRLLTAKRLLTDTALSVTDVAHASGFRSLRRFQAAFRDRYRLQPSALRARSRADAGELVLDLAYRPPYDWESILGFLAGRAIPGVESVENDAYRRTVAIGRSRGWIAVRHIPARRALRVEVSGSLAKAVPAVLVRVKRLFDLSCRPDAVAEALGPLASSRPGLRVPGAFDGFEVAVRGILGQQVSVAAASRLTGKFAKRFGAPIDTPVPGLELVFPAASTVAAAGAEAITDVGLVRARAGAIHAVAKACASGAIRLVPGVDVEATVDALVSLPGIGPWTAQYLAMRALAWPDAFPEGDLVLRKALGGVTAKEALARAEAWRPWRAYAAMHVWRNTAEVER